jgi:hypothetical protein
MDVSRRFVLFGAIAAPAVIAAENLMPVRSLWTPENEVAVRWTEYLFNDKGALVPKRVHWEDWSLRKALLRYPDAPKDVRVIISQDHPLGQGEHMYVSFAKEQTVQDVCGFDRENGQWIHRLEEKKIIRTRTSYDKKTLDRREAFIQSLRTTG